MLRLLKTPEPEPSTPGQDAAAAQQSDPLWALATRVAQGERAAEQTLLTAVGAAVLGIVRRVLGVNHPELEDVCQEAAIALLSALPGFRGECSTLHFACRVALLTALAARRRYRRNAAHRTGSDEEPDDCAEVARSPAELVDAARRRSALRELLDELPMHQAEVLALHVVLGHTVEETSTMIGVPVNTVRSRLRRGLAALRERLSLNQNLRELVE
jgi:RNA polymerase sigma factor (sigma-70 family)